MALGFQISFSSIALAISFLLHVLSNPEERIEAVVLGRPVNLHLTHPSLDLPLCHLLRIPEVKWLQSSGSVQGGLLSEREAPSPSHPRPASSMCPPS